MALPLPPPPPARRVPGCGAGLASRLIGGWLGLWLWLCLGAAQAQPVFEVPPQAASVALTDELEYLVDQTGRWRPASGEAPPGEWQVLRTRPGKARFGFSEHAVWYRISLRAKAPLERLWVVPGPQLEWVEWVIEQPGQAPRRVEAGLGPMQTGRSETQREPQVRLHIGPAQPLTVYMRAQTRGPLLLPVELWEPGSWQARERRVLMWQGLYFGLFGGLLLYNGFIALRLREAAYGYYAGFGAAMCVYQLSSTLFGPNLLWPDWALWTHGLMRLSVSVFGFAGLMFTDRFLSVRSFAPRLSRLLRLTALVCLLTIPGHRLLPELWMALVSAPLGLWSASLLMVAGWRAWRRRMPAASYFLLGWTGVVLAVLVRVMVPLGWLPFHPVLNNSLLIATAGEMLLLSLALADRIAQERRARAEADLRRVREQAAREKAQHTLEEKSRFMAAITHDLQQPLYALSLATESVVRQGTKPLSPQALNQMRSALFAADELMASLAMNLRLDRENLQPEFELFSVQEMLERIDALFATRAQQTGLRWRVLPSLAVVHSDPLMLERMLCNLVSNAMRYTQCGGVLLSCRPRGDHLLIQVWDTGPGIPEHEQAAIFEAYRRGSAAQSKDQGLGLGLSIVSRCASLLGVRVGLRSEPGRGSCFALRVPLAPRVD